MNYNERDGIYISRKKQGLWGGSISVDRLKEVGHEKVLDAKYGDRVEFKFIEGNSNKLIIKATNLSTGELVYGFIITRGWMKDPFFLLNYAELISRQNDDDEEII